MEYSPLEYIIKQKNEGNVALKKAAVIASALLLFILLLIVILNLTAPLLHSPFILLDLVFCIMAFIIAWQFVNVEYEIIMSSDTIELTVIYGKRFRKRLSSIPINSLGEVGLYDDAAYEKLCASSLKKNYICISSLSAPIIYYALFDEDGQRCVLYFEADERAIKHIKRQNPGAIRAGNIK